MENEREKKEAGNGAPRVRTYERDVEEFLKQEGGTAAKFALAEQERRIEKIETIPPYPIPPPGGGSKRVGWSPLQNPPAIPSPEAVRQRVYARSLVLWSMLFLALAGAVGIGYWYFAKLPPREAAPIGASAQNIVLADREKTLDATRLARESLVSAFARERGASLALSSFVRITPVVRNQESEIESQSENRERALTTEEFLSLLQTRVPGELVRALAPSFVLGLRGLPQNRAFLVFKTPYYRTALAGMLQWEPSLFYDLGPLFGSPSANASAPASAETLAGRATGFADRTVQNRDVRVFLGEGGRPLILWGFADQRTIIIADDEDTFQKVMGRLIATK